MALRPGARRGQTPQPRERGVEGPQRPQGVTALCGTVPNSKPRAGTRATRRARSGRSSRKSHSRPGGGEPPPGESEGGPGGWAPNVKEQSQDAEGKRERPLARKPRPAPGARAHVPPPRAPGPSQRASQLRTRPPAARARATGPRATCAKGTAMRSNCQRPPAGRTREEVTLLPVTVLQTGHLPCGLRQMNRRPSTAGG